MKHCTILLFALILASCTKEGTRQVEWIIKPMGDSNGSILVSYTSKDGKQLRDTLTLNGEEQTWIHEFSAETGSFVTLEGRKLSGFEDNLCIELKVNGNLREGVMLNDVVQETTGAQVVRIIEEVK
jgi:hypothetical protein